MNKEKEINNLNTFKFTKKQNKYIIKTMIQ